MGPKWALWGGAKHRERYRSGIGAVQERYRSGIGAFFWFSPEFGRGLGGEI